MTTKGNEAETRPGLQVCLAVLEQPSAAILNVCFQTNAQRKSGFVVSVPGSRLYCWARIQQTVAIGVMAKDRGVRIFRHLHVSFSEKDWEIYEYNSVEKRPVTHFTHEETEVQERRKPALGPGML